MSNKSLFQAISTISNEEIVDLLFLLVYYLCYVMLFYLCGHVVVYMLEKETTRARIIKANRLVEAQILSFRPRRYYDRGERTWASMKLSYEYENENYLVWKKVRRNIFQSEEYCNVYVDPLNPSECVVQQDLHSQCARYFGILFGFSIFQLYYIYKLPQADVYPVLRNVTAVLYGCAFYAPIIAFIWKSLFQHADYSVLGVERTPDIELNNESSTKNSESTVFSEEESTVATEIL